MACKLLRRTSALIWIAVAGSAAAAPADLPADLLIEGGTVYSGADAAPLTGDVVIAADKIVYEIGRAHV